MRSASFFGDLMQSIAERGRQLLASAPREYGRRKDKTTPELCEMLLSSYGEASGMAIAGDIMARWEAFDADERLEFMAMLLDVYLALTD
jgi:malonyl-CoA decarboxylase